MAEELVAIAGVVPVAETTVVMIDLNGFPGVGAGPFFHRLIAVLDINHVINLDQ